MALDPQKRNRYLHFYGDDTHNHTLPAAALVKSLQALQRSIQIVAASKKASGEKIYPYGRDPDKYSVTLGVPENGGYTLPYTVGGPAQALFDIEEVESIIRKHEHLLGSIENNNFREVENAFPMPHQRKLFLREIRNLQPHPRHRVKLAIENDQRQSIFDASLAYSRIDTILDEFDQVTAQRTVLNGRLDGIDFQNRVLKLRLTDNRTILGNYIDDLEEGLLDNPREWVRLSCEAHLDIEGRVLSISDIKELEEIDTSTMEIPFPSELSNHNKMYSAKIDYLPEDNLYVATGDFNIVVTGANRGQIVSEVQDEIRLLWHTYVEVDASELSADAFQLRQDILRALRDADSADRH